MQKSLLSSVIQVAGFAVIGSLFIIWFLGNQENSDSTSKVISAENEVARGEFNTATQPPAERSTYVESSYSKSSDYTRRSYKEPEPVSQNYTSSSSRATRNEASLSPSVERSRSKSAVQKATAVRSWKGVHRDESFAWLCFDRFGKDVVALSEEHGLYPDVFLSRIIAYSYEFTNDPRVSPADNNFLGLSQPKNRDRARFRSAEESLKAYAVVHAGEVTRLSKEGAIAKNDRAWTMRKIIDKYAFVGNLTADLADREEYKGRVSRVNKASDKENYQREMVGEAIKMTSKVDDIVKKRRAENAGYSNWEDYLDDLTEEERSKQKEEAEAKTSAISKKKAFSLSRRVNAKKRKQ